MTNPRDNVHEEQLEDPVGPEYQSYSPEDTAITGAYNIDENQEKCSPYDTDEDEEGRYQYDENGEFYCTDAKEELESSTSKRAEQKGKSHQRIKRGEAKERSESTKRAEKERFDRKEKEAGQKNKELEREARERKKKGKERKA
ncbi:hypothetical protein EYC80_007764 [Monilinia laxa]|uniref:Uncharacterized protein n=1 Tax=Monilinia laxa TaxID=61186 RepID=A0A5N6JWY3_MONLA|nr:hypothetical protein EYC80_007764 [Monilinia laxa]